MKPPLIILKVIKTHVSPIAFTKVQSHKEKMVSHIHSKCFSALVPLPCFFFLPYQTAALGNKLAILGKVPQTIPVS